MEYFYNKVEAYKIVEERKPGQSEAISFFNKQFNLI